MGDSSKITTDIAIDDAIQLDANFRLDAHDRRYLDNQVLGCQTHLVNSLLSGYAATWGILDAASVTVNPGDVICVKDNAVTKATAADLANAGAACGIVLATTGPNGRVHFAIDGILPPTVSGLGSGAALPVRVNTTTGRLERVGGYLSTDYPIGISDINGYVTLNLGTSPVTVSAGGMTTPSGTGFVHITGSVEDGAARAVNLNSADVTSILQVANGGTGLSSPGTNGYVLTSNGTTWVSAPAAFTAPGGTGFIHVTSGTMDGTARAVNLNSSDITGILNYTAGGTGLSTLGSALQVLRTNAAGTAIEWGTISTSGSPGGSNTQLQYNNAGAFGGTTEFTYASSKLNVSATGAITYGSAPAGTGATRYSNALAIKWNNFVGSADVSGITVDASNNLILGDQTNAANVYSKASIGIYGQIGASVITTVGSTGLSVSGQVSASTSVIANAFVFTGSTVEIVSGTGVPASSPVNGSIYLRTDGSSSTAIYSRQSGAWVAIGGGGSTSPGGSNTQLQYNNSGSFGGMAEFTYASSKLNVSASGVITLNGSTCTNAYIRGKNGESLIAVRNFADGADMIALSSDSSNHLYFGDATNTTQAHLRSNAASVLNVAGTNVFYAGADGSHHTFGNLMTANGTAVSIGSESPSFASGTNILAIYNGTAPSSDAGSTNFFLYSDGARATFRNGNTVSTHGTDTNPSRVLLRLDAMVTHAVGTDQTNALRVVYRTPLGTDGTFGYIPIFN